MKKPLFFAGFAILFLWIDGFNPVHAQNPSQNKLLGVVAMVKGNTIDLEGYCIYVKDGKEVKKNLTKNNAWGWNFRGDYVKEVKLRKVSGDASFQLFVMEGKDAATGQPVFESDWISSTKPVIYKRKVQKKK